MKSKKGSEKMEWPGIMVNLIFNGVLILLSIIIIMTVLAGISGVSINTGQLKAELYKARLMNSPSCLAWEDEFMVGSIAVSAVHAGVIDPNKIDSTRISNCIPDREYNIILEWDYVDSTQQKHVYSIDTVKETVGESYLVKVYDGDADDLENGVLKIWL